MELKAVKIFRDKTSPEKVYKEGEALNVEDLDRINDLVSRGLCVITAIGEAKPQGQMQGGTMMPLFEKEFEVDTIKEALKTIGVQVAGNAGVPGVTKKIQELTPEQSTALSEILCKE